MSKKTLESVIKAISKNAKNNYISTPVFENDYMVYAVDGHQVMRTIEDVDVTLIGESNDDLIKTCNRIFEEDFKTECQIIMLPHVKNLNNKIKDLKMEWKQKSKEPIKLAYAISKDILVNVNYLLNALKATDTDHCYAIGKYAPIYFFGEDTQYAVLPIRNDGDLTAGEFNILN